LPIDKQQDYKSAVLSAVAVRKYEQPSVTLRSALLKVSNSTASRIASFKFWGRDCLMRIQAIRRLVNLAYPTVPENVRDTLAKQHFMEPLADSEMRIRIKQSRPQNLNDAIRLAVELETFNRAERMVTGRLSAGFCRRSVS
jgi:hypothetical protein